ANPAWASDPTQGVGGTDQAQQWGSGQAQQWGTGSTQQWGAGQPQQWGTPAPAYPEVARPQGSTSGAAVTGGVIAIVGALGIIGACALPVTTNTFGLGSNGGSISLFKELGTGTAGWTLVEPIGVAGLAVLAGGLVMVNPNRGLPGLNARVLRRFRVQTPVLFPRHPRR